MPYVEMDDDDVKLALLNYKVRDIACNKEHTQNLR